MKRLHLKDAAGEKHEWVRQIGPYMTGRLTCSRCGRTIREDAAPEFGCGGIEVLRKIYYGGVTSYGFA